MLVAMLAAVASAQAQEAATLSADVVLSDFGVERPSDIVRGRVSVVRAPEGPRLEVHYLTDLPAPPAEGGSAELPAGARPPDPATSAAAAAGRSDAPLASLWVWNTAQLLASAAERAAFLDLVDAEGIDRIFLQLPPGEELAPQAGFVPFDGSALGPLVAELRARGALTYALDGDPEYARPQNHEGVTRTVARVVAHNRASSPNERFHGMRYDVEPYLLPGFQGPRRREILSGYVRMVEEVSRVARAGGLAMGVDIPFWLDGVDEVTGERFLGDRGRAGPTPVLEAVLDLVDDVAVMAYRTEATGPDGVLDHMESSLALAAERGVGVFVGIETTPIADEERYTLHEPGCDERSAEPGAAWVVLEELGERRARVRLVQDAETLESLREAPRAGPDSLICWYAGPPVPLPGARLSFHSLGLGAMRRVEGELLRELGASAAFRGVAYHDYVGLRSLLGR